MKPHPTKFVCDCGWSGLGTIRKPVFKPGKLEIEERCPKCLEKLTDKNSEPY